MKQLKSGTLLMILLSGFATSCAPTRTVLVPSGDPVQLRHPVKADVWTFDKDGNRVPGQMVIPEGWYFLPDEAANNAEGSK